MQEPKEQVLELEPLAVRRETAAKMLDCSPTTIWKMCRDGQLKTIKVRGDIRILVKSIKAVGSTAA